MWTFEYDEVMYAIPINKIDAIMYYPKSKRIFIGYGTKQGISLNDKTKEDYIEIVTDIRGRL